MCEKNDFPNELYRGVSVKACKTEQGYVMPSVFQFEEYNESRIDNFCELSINWNDDDGALDNLAHATKKNKNGELYHQFQYGYCLIERASLDQAFRTFIDDGIVNYERKPLKENKDKNFLENPYHGNILVDNDTEKVLKKNFERTLATIAGKVIEWDI